MEVLNQLAAVELIRPAGITLFGNGSRTQLNRPAARCRVTNGDRPAAGVHQLAETPAAFRPGTLRISGCGDPRDSLVTKGKKVLFRPL